MSSDVSVKKILVLADTLLLVSALGLSACASRLIPPSVEYLSPPEPEKVEYIAEPPNDLARLLFSTDISEQLKGTAWSNAQGKWVVWVGNVHHVEPQLKPSRIGFVYEYETSSMSFDNGQFRVTVKFDPAWMQQLKQLTTGEFVYYRAKLVKYEPGLGSNLLTLEEGQIIHRDDIAAKLVDLAFASYEQLETLIADAEKITNISNYFEQKANLVSDLKRNLLKLALKLVHIDLGDETQHQEAYPSAVQMKAALAQSEIEERLRVTLESLHSDTGRYGKLGRQDIEEQIESNKRIIKTIEDGIRELENIMEKDRLSSEPGIVNLISTAVTQLINVIIPGSGLVIGATTATADVIAEIGQLPLYQQVVVICQTYLGLIDESMEHIRQGVVEVSDKIVK